MPKHMSCLLCLCLCATTWGCKPEQPPPPAKTGIFEINLRPSFNGMALQPGLFYAVDSYKVCVDTLQLLMTGPRLDDGPEFYDRPFVYSFLPQTAKTAHGAGVYYVFEVAEKRYAGARIRCGPPDGLPTGATPEDFPDDHPLGKNERLFESGGYTHLKICGKTVHRTDTAAFRYLLFQPPFEFQTPKSFDIRAGRETQWILEPELSLFFQGFSPQAFSHIGDSSEKFVREFRRGVYSYLREY